MLLGKQESPTQEAFQRPLWIPSFLLLRGSRVLSRGHRGQPALQGDEHQGG